MGSSFSLLPLRIWGISVQCFLSFCSFFCCYLWMCWPFSQHHRWFRVKKFLKLCGPSILPTPFCRPRASADSLLSRLTLLLSLLPLRGWQQPLSSSSYKSWVSSGLYSVLKTQCISFYVVSSSYSMNVEYQFFRSSSCGSSLSLSNKRTSFSCFAGVKWSGAYIVLIKIIHDPYYILLADKIIRPSVLCSQRSPSGLQHEILLVEKQTAQRSQKYQWVSKLKHRPWGCRSHYCGDTKSAAPRSSPPGQYPGALPAHSSSTRFWDPPSCQGSPPCCPLRAAPPLVAAFADPSAQQNALSAPSALPRCS